MGLVYCSIHHKAVKYTPLPEQLPKCSVVFIVECTVVEIVIIVHHAKKILIKDIGAAKTVQYIYAPEQVGVYDVYTLLPMHEIGQNQHKKGGWAYTTSWVYNTYSMVVSKVHKGCYNGINCLLYLLIHNNNIIIFLWPESIDGEQ